MNSNRACHEMPRGYGLNHRLNALRTNRPLCVAAVVATLIAWFVLSNHCALGGWARVPRCNRCTAAVTMAVGHP
jgi:hypothetical protein